MSHTAIDSYQSTEALTSDPVRVTLMLFDGALRFLADAERALARGDAAGFARSQSRAHAIVDMLASCLNREAGGEIAANLERLYDFMLRHLTEGLVARDPEPLRQVAALLREIRDAFEQVSTSTPGARA